MDRDVNRNKLTRRHAVTLLGAGAIVPFGRVQSTELFRILYDEQGP